MNVISILSLIVFIILIGLFFFLKKTHWKRLKRYESPLSGFVDVYEKLNGEKVLMTNYFVQGVSTEKSSIKRSYWYAVAKDAAIHSSKKKHPEILFIGLGANTSSSLLLKMNKNIKQTIVEIDPVVVQACREYFSLDEASNFKIVNKDIYVLLKTKKKNWKKKFDTIVIDTFSAKPPYLLSGSHDPKFLEKLYIWLKDDGQFLFNIPVKTQGIHVDVLVSYLKTIFNIVNCRIIRDPRGFRNYVINASLKKKVA